MNNIMQLDKFCVDYANKLSDLLSSSDWSGVNLLGKHMRDCWLTGRQVFFAVTVAVQVMQFILPMIFCMVSLRERGQV